jgi:hypothetical protein
MARRCVRCGADINVGSDYCDTCFLAVSAEDAAAWDDALRSVTPPRGKVIIPPFSPATTPDPDKDPDMEPTLTARDPDAGPATLTRDGETIVGRTGPIVESLIDAMVADPAAAEFIQRARVGEGTQTLGLYVEAVAFAANNVPMSHMKFFVIDKNLYVYNRQKGDLRANWRRRVVMNLATALGTVQAAIDKPTVKVLGHPVLVELTADDWSAAEGDAMPPARFRGQSRIQKQFGRYEFEGPVQSIPVSDAAVRLLRDGFARPDGFTRPASPAAH